MSDRLDDIRVKIGRAQEHLEVLNDTANAFLQSDFYTLAFDADQKRRQIVVKATKVQPMPPVIGVLIGDTAHQLRSILDHLMWLLAKPTSEKAAQLVQFPLVRSHRNFVRHTRHMMPGVARGVRTLVERLQPYHRRKWPETGLLGQLQVISNWDKHRTLTTAAASIEGNKVNLRIIGAGIDQRVTSEEKFRGILKSDTVLARIDVSSSLPEGTTVHVNPELGLLPVFDEGMPKPIRRSPVINTLGRAGNFISNKVIPMFERFL